MIDLRSDTVTRPTAEMKRAMVEAPVGDDVMGEDPTINLLEEMVADRLGKEAALYCCTATQANQIAVRVHCTPGDEALISDTGHIGVYEGGAPAALSGVSIRQVEAARGMLDVAALEGLPWPDNCHHPRTRLVCLENTTNLGGGYCYPLPQLEEVTAWARGAGLKSHLDGARLFNAAVATGEAPRAIAAGFDTLTLCFSKGLGCPMGAALAGSREQIRLARRARKIMGGGLRQGGIVAAVAVYALEHHVDRLAEDHARAARLAEGIRCLPGLAIAEDSPQSNLVFIDLDPAWGKPEDLVSRLREREVLVGKAGSRRLRAVTHLDVGDADIEAAIAAFCAVLR